MTKIKCVIAAGGLGTRLQGFRQNDKTKVLLEVNGITMINRQIYQINKWGIEEFIIITSPDFDELIRQVTIKEFPNLNINYSIQEPPQGISHAFEKAKSFVNKNDILLLVLGDNFFGENPIKSIDFAELEKVLVSFTSAVSDTATSVSVVLKFVLSSNTTASLP